jgi:hypothetical protein
VVKGPFVAHKIKQFVFFDRAPDGAAKLVVYQRTYARDLNGFNSAE